MPLGRHRFRGNRKQSSDAAPAEAAHLDVALAAELRTRLEALDEPGLAARVPDLRVVNDCPCGDPNCESFYTVPRFQAMWFWNRGGRTIPLGDGLAVDAVGDRIVAVEIVRDGDSRRRRALANQHP
jgi:hypothetical protein